MGKQVSRFLGIDDLVHTTLSTEAPTTRRSAKFVLDQARSGSDFGLYDDCPSLEPRQAFVEIPNGVVRGSVVIDSPSGTILPRTCHPSPRDGFINYMKESQYDFESGLKLRFGRPYLDNMHEYYIDDDVLYLTPDESNNYGMWLLQVLPALRYAETSGFEGILLCQLDLPWQQAFIAAFGPRVSKRLMRHTAGTAFRAKKLFVVAQDHRNFTLTKFERNMFDHVVREAGPREGGSKTIYISRVYHAHKHPMYRVLLNEAVLIEKLQDYGVEIVEPEKMHFFDQVRLFSNADSIIGVGGANMFSAVFCRPGAKIVTIESSPGWITAHSNLFDSAGLDYGVILGRQLKNDPPPHQRWMLDIDSALSAIVPFMKLKKAG